MELKIKLYEKEVNGAVISKMGRKTGRSTGIFPWNGLVRW